MHRSLARAASVTTLANVKHPRCAIHRVTSAAPTKVVPQAQAKDQLVSFMRNLNPVSPLIPWVEKVFEKSGINQRHMAYVPDLIHEYQGRNFNQVAEESFVHAVELGRQVTDSSLSESDLVLRDITAAFIGTDLTSGNSIDCFTHIVPGGNPRVKGVPMIGKGCGGGVANLARAADYLKAHSDEVVQTVNVDVYSRLWAYAFGNLFAELGVSNGAVLDNETKLLLRRTFVPAVILGDAAVATVMLGENHPKYHSSVHEDGSFVICDTQSQTVAGQTDLVKLAMRSYGPVPYLSEKIPDIGAGAVKDAIEQLLLRHPEVASAGGPSFYCAHPGGAKVLDRLQELMSLTPADLQHSRDILAEYGNCAGPTVLLVLERMVRKLPPATKHEFGIIAAVGPGMIAEAILVERFPAKNKAASA